MLRRRSRTAELRDQVGKLSGLVSPILQSQPKGRQFLKRRCGGAPTDREDCSRRLEEIG